ncbi:MAG: hypothetical protein ACFFAS_06165 [Promethearchaeota archaeon]
MSEDKNNWNFFIIGVLILNVINIFSGFLPHFQPSPPSPTNASINLMYIILGIINLVLSVLFIAFYYEYGVSQKKKYHKISLILSRLLIYLCIIIMGFYIGEYIMWFMVDADSAEPTLSILYYGGFSLGLVCMIFLSILEIIWVKNLKS